MFTSDVSEPYETVKRPILKRGNLKDQQRLDQLLNNIDLQHGSATDMLIRMSDVIDQRTFDDDLFKQLLLSNLPQQVQAVLVSIQNNTVDELAESTDLNLEITKSSNSDVSTVKEKPQTTHNDITELCHTLTRNLRIHNDSERSQTCKRSSSRKRSVSSPRGTDYPDWCWYHNQQGRSRNYSSAPYSRTVLTFVLKILTLVFFDSCSEFQMLFSCTYAALALPISAFTSASNPTCSSMMLPRYVKGFTSSKSSTSIVTALVHAVLYRKILLYPLYILGPNAAEAGATLVISCTC
ncbi:unnamed protein product [Schistosoma curassoni]|uniref:NET domain-containing protein n=1 Tax=Schistosoma curassoni TaxID=6186 RepID=A0A183KL38_9TREM|nr:unnamed protein product [Schistosoma curassoni]